MRTGIATIPLDYGKCPYWLFERMKRLSRGIILAIAEKFGGEEILKRLSDPVWFQSLGCVIGFDWNSSGLGTTTMGALKEGLRGLENELGIFVCGGKGKTSRKTPEQIQNWGEFLGWPMEKIDKLVYASKISAKVDSSCLQDLQNPFQIYHHNLIFSKSGQWCVVQQGMATEIQKARRYHWLSSNIRDFTEEPHSGIISDIKSKPLNLVAKKSRGNKEISTELVKEEPKTFLKDFSKIINKSDALVKQKRMGNFTEMELNDVEFHRHPVLKEKFDLKRLEKTIFLANEQNPQNFEQLLSLKGVGPKTIRALSLVSEIIYGARPSYEDPARYSFAFGGKDGTPRPVEKNLMDKTLEIMEKGIKKAKISNREKVEAQRRLIKTIV
ncbi:DUF763 domain-containing protein [bacterium]|uniref:DUF763 domain-containing protein n=4 Tax=Candidatus Nealsoniibacteriota TaxID=1817911 RepID=A0A2M7EB88_9BACT|nr:DUF763 domain-containing protein [bacterium]PIV64993.1 MAG: DUF763 domain-containing protein [Candidatus Nealsonbacteria bacterium CG01_land_8_20_14_3_00_12]PIW34709.1 MAG: DUF763 domain-containing protein [Candidatus Nealsonbacteria bacterium CG15_BIG_FIL_POST_REV_8_21_14_020_37_12]PIW91590.1 MAG: DUF763 domain-containing protein [Candidatus Nealsonbacteria bacterium CG_4_8_14_3_um_filter_37_36]PJA83483.1 MAG: DUF763 domain-containing protein [Candidatus Nealsonbacteria bacterium CG_4_9_14_